jgi:hypothetical protein
MISMSRPDRLIRISSRDPMKSSRYHHFDLWSAETAFTGHRVGLLRRHGRDALLRVRFGTSRHSFFAAAVNALLRFGS